MAKSIVKMRGQGCKDCRHTHYFSFILVISGSCEWKILKEIQLLRLVFVSQKCQDEAHKFGHFWELKRTISKQDSNTEACCRVCCKNASRTRPRGRPAHTSAPWHPHEDGLKLKLRLHWESITATREHILTTFALWNEPSRLFKDGPLVEFCVLFLWVPLAFHAFFQPQFLRVNELITNRLAIVEETTC